MNTGDRKKLKDELRAVAAGHGAGIDLDTSSHWVVESVKDPAAFFQHLPLLMPPDSILYVEGTSIAADLVSFYRSHPARNAVAVIRDTIFPAPAIYHVTFSLPVSVGLREFAACRPVKEMFDHVKAYRGESVIFTFHDAFDGQLRISAHVSEAIVMEFCRKLQVIYRCEETKARYRGQLRSLLERVETRRQPCSRWKLWWRRLLGR